MAADPPDSPASQWQRLTLDVEVDSEPLSGVLHADGVEVPFTGWLGLAGALLRASEPQLSAEGAASPASPTTEPPATAP